MQRLFFHNKYDKDSISILNTLDEDVIVYDVFSDDKYKIPKDIKLVVVPYMIDKQLLLLTQGPYYTGTVSLQLQCCNYLGEYIQEDVKFFVEVDGNIYETWAIDGVINIEIDCQCPTTLSVKLLNERDGYMPYSFNIDVIEKVQEGEPSETDV